ncbi:SRPBCC family protein [Paenibacillus aestuarii]|uniref:SRPBCC family protein n=1 Tax=Paenibacillus aestuarii TaxID=516965 RepID=A0ABW0KAY5_9BACL|nr:SRPBCC family protein [Paenibacillus aestuarii]
MNNHVTLVDVGTVRVERLLPGPIERVWTYLTDSEKRGTWLAAGNIELRVGGKVELNFIHSQLSDFVEPTPERYKHLEQGHTNYGIVTRCEEPFLLSYTWGDGSEDASEVTYELTLNGEEVLLVLTHRQLSGERAVMVSVAAGWHTHLDILGDQLNGRKRRAFWSTHAVMEAEYEKKL